MTIKRYSIWQADGQLHINTPNSPETLVVSEQLAARDLLVFGDLLAALQGLRAALRRWQQGEMNSEECQLAEVVADVAIAKATA